MKARLAHYRGNELESQIVLADDVTRIGRGLGNHVQLTDPKVSKKHAIIRTSGRHWVIEDAGSTNGVCVNGQRIKKPTVLERNDQVLLGNATYTFECGSGEDWHSPVTIDASENAAMKTMAGPIHRPPK